MRERRQAYMFIAALFCATALLADSKPQPVQGVNSAGLTLEAKGASSNPPQVNTPAAVGEPVDARSSASLPRLELAAPAWDDALEGEVSASEGAPIRGARGGLRGGQRDMVIWDNYPDGAVAEGALSSQWFTNYDIQSQNADDFIFTDNPHYVSRVQWQGHYWNPAGATPNTVAFHIYMYPDDGDVPCLPAADPSPESGPTDGCALVHHTIPIADVTVTDLGGDDYEYEAELPAEFDADQDVKYWIAIQSESAFPPQWGIAISATDQEHLPWYGFPYLDDPFWTLQTNGDTAFRLMGMHGDYWCGDGIAQAGLEECDPGDPDASPPIDPDDELCPGECTEDCECPPLGACCDDDPHFTGVLCPLGDECETGEECATYVNPFECKSGPLCYENVTEQDCVETYGGRWELDTACEDMVPECHVCGLAFKLGPCGACCDEPSGECYPDSSEDTCNILTAGEYSFHPGLDCEEAPCNGACCPTSPFGDGFLGDHVVPPGMTLYLTGDADYRNLTIEEGGTVNTAGYTLLVCNTLWNEGTIRAPYSGGSGGDGGDGGKGANPVHAPSDPTGCGRVYNDCTPGQPGENGSGRGGDGGCGGGGGGGAENLGLDADGGNGGAGGDGGDGGGDLLLYAFRLDNGGEIHADGQDGSDGEDAPAGDSTDPDGYEHCGAEYYAWPETFPLHDVEGGGGGGGSGGDGGDGGTVEIYYAQLLSLGTIRADGGFGGSEGGFGGSEGGFGGSKGGCDQHIDVLGSHQDGCPDGCGHSTAGYGGHGEHRIFYCSEDGHDGAEGSQGEGGNADWNVVVFNDCNDNGFPDDCDIFGGSSDDYDLNGVPDECEDCNENGIPDACDLDCGIGDCASHPLGCGGSEDYDLNGVPDECEDCNENGIPDACDLDCGIGDCASHPLGCGGSEDCNENGIPDECEMLDVVSVCSSHLHGEAGEFCLELGVSPDYNWIEPRGCGVRELVCEMNVSVDPATASPDNVQVVCVNNVYEGTIGTSLGDGTYCSDAELVITFDPALPDEDCCRVTLDDMSSAYGQPSVAELPVRTLIGDVNRNNLTESGDAAACWNYVGQPPDSGNFTADQNCNGVIEWGDCLYIRNYVGNQAADCQQDCP